MYDLPLVTYIGYNVNLLLDIILCNNICEILEKIIYQRWGSNPCVHLHIGT